jgi:hypothetical protein
MRLDEGLMLLFLKVINIFLEGIVPVKMEMSLVVVLGERKSTHAMYSSHHSTSALNLREELRVF